MDRNKKHWAVCYNENYASGDCPHAEAPPCPCGAGSSINKKLLAPIEWPRSLKWDWWESFLYLFGAQANSSLEPKRIALWSPSEFKGRGPMSTLSWGNIILFPQVNLTFWVVLRFSILIAQSTGNRKRIKKFPGREWWKILYHYEKWRNLGGQVWKLFENIVNTNA